MSTLYVADPDVAASGWLNWLDESLWIKYPDRTALLPRPNLEALYNRPQTPTTPTEKLHAANPNWLRILLDHVLGHFIIEIPAGGPLPEWSLEGIKRALREQKP